VSEAGWSFAYGRIDECNTHGYLGVLRSYALPESPINTLHIGLEAPFRVLGCCCKHADVFYGSEFMEFGRLR
jgi:hypothetical protein